MATAEKMHRAFGSRAYFEAMDAMHDNNVEELQRLANTRVYDYKIPCSTILFWPIERGNLEMTKILLEAGFDRDYYMTATRGHSRIFSPLHSAFKIKDQEIRRKMVRLLVEYGVDPRKEHLYSESCIYKAVQQGDCEMVRFLLDEGCDVNYCNIECAKGVRRSVARGYSPLHVAVVELDGDVRVEMVKLLIELGADANAREGYSRSSCLHLIAVQKLKSCEVLELLLDAGAQINFLDSKNWSPLAEAAYHGDIELMKMMIAAGANVDLSEECIGSPLYNAVMVYHKDAVQLLLENGANPNPVDGESILCFAVSLRSRCLDYKLNTSIQAEYIDILKILFAYEVNPRGTTSTDCSKYFVRETPFQLALMYGTVEAIKLFLENDVTLENCGVPHPLHIVATNDTKDILEFLLETRHYDVDAINNDYNRSYTALFTAVDCQRADNVRLLIEWGADVNIPHIDTTEGTEKPAVTSPLYRAVGNIDPENVELLLSAGANMDLDTGFGTWLCILKRILDEEYEKVLAPIIGEVTLLKHRCHSCTSGENVSILKFANLSPELEKQCSSELEELKNFIFYDTCTLYDLLQGKNVTRYVRNSNVADNFKSLRVIERFPMYGNRIMNCYSLAKAKRDLIDEGSRRLNVVLQFRFCNQDDILYGITSHLSFKDLRNLCNV